MKRTEWATILLVALLGGLFGFGLVTYIMSGEKVAYPSAPQGQPTPQVSASQTRQTANTNTQSTQPTKGEDDSILSSLGVGDALPAQAQAESWTTVVPRIIGRLALAALLAGMLAFRPRKDLPMRQRNLYVAQTQILLAVVASALMMIVGDSAARAFGIFAAVSVVRFRTNIRDPKEITVLLISLSLGLATGVGRWDLGIILALFVLPLLWLLEAREQEEAFRSMELTVKTRNTTAMQEVLRQVFQKHGFDAELRQIDPPDVEEPLGCIMYSVSMNLGASTDQISEEIRTADPNNVDAIEWKQRKDSSYIYQ